MIAPNSLQLGLIFVVLSGEPDAPQPPPPPQCGVAQRQVNPHIQTRIVGGYGANEGAWPWQIAVLDRKKRLICGGTLISAEFVLTAAHCITSNMRIVAGEYNLAEPEGFEQERRVSKWHRHPRYSKETKVNDIALLRLERPLELTAKVRPACLPEQDEELRPEQRATILGWGAISYIRAKLTDQLTDQLHQAEVPVVDFDECIRNYNGTLEGFKVICAGFREGRIDSCAGDSGGPLLVEKDNRWHVYGVTSLGDECAKKDKFGIYSKTSAYVDWINGVMANYTNSRLNW